MMEKEKICPVCGERNPPNLLECRKCETDLTGIKPGNIAAANNFNAPAAADIQNGSLIKLCECGAQNFSQARVCASCGEDISDIEPAPKQAHKKRFALVALNGDYSFLITKPVCLIGRECEMGNFLKNNLYVSRRHAKITVVNEEVYIENLSLTNSTYINNEPIPKDKPIYVTIGDEIGFGGNAVNSVRQKQAAYFTLQEIL
jgi:ribosomal protein L40E